MGKVLATHPPPPGGCVHVMKQKEADDLFPQKTYVSCFCIPGSPMGGGCIVPPITKIDLTFLFFNIFS